MSETMLMSVEEQLEDLNDGTIVLLESQAEKSMDASYAALDSLINKQGKIGIVVTANRPYANLMSLYQQKGIDVNKILFIDCISKSQGLDLGKGGNVLFLDSAEDLTKIALSITGSISRIEANKFVMVDSLTTLLIHNPPQMLARFMHGVLTKMRMSNASGIILSIDKQTDNEVRAEVAQLCDRVVKL